MTAVKIAVAAIDTRWPFGNTRIVRLRRTVRLEENPGCGIVSVIAKIPARFREQLHLSAMAQRRQREIALTRAGKRIFSCGAGNTEFPFEFFVVWLEIVIAER